MLRRNVDIILEALATSEARTCAAIEVATRPKAQAILTIPSAKRPALTRSLSALREISDDESPFDLLFDATGALRVRLTVTPLTIEVSLSPQGTALVSLSLNA